MRYYFPPLSTVGIDGTVEAKIDPRCEYFDSESLARMDAALDQAWRTIPPDQQTPETRSALAKAIVLLASQGESLRPLTTLLP